MKRTDLIRFSSINPAIPPPARLLPLILMGFCCSAGLQAQQPVTNLRYNPVAPCRIWDTRNGSGPTGIFGAGETRPQNMAGLCNLPSSAKAYALNITLIPSGAAKVTLWANGATQPPTDTIVEPLGRVVANNAIVEAGTNGAISIYSQGSSHIISVRRSWWPAPMSASLEEAVPGAKLSWSGLRVSQTR